jgi:hypothetical protein
MFQSWPEEATKNIFWCKRTEENRGDSHPNWMWYTIIMVNLCCQRAYHSEFQIDWDTIGYTRIPSCHPRPVGGPYPGASTTQLTLDEVWLCLKTGYHGLPMDPMWSYMILVPPKMQSSGASPYLHILLNHLELEKHGRKSHHLGVPKLGIPEKSFYFNRKTKTSPSTLVVSNFQTNSYHVVGFVP